MSAIIFDGFSLAGEREKLLKPMVEKLAKYGIKIKIAAILFTEDAGSRLYSGLKQQAAERLGIEYQLYSFSLNDDPREVAHKISSISAAPDLTGVIVQKPWRQTWAQIWGGEDLAMRYDSWWQSLVEKIDPDKDVDGLHPSTLAAIEADQWQEKGRVLPATCRAVLIVLQQAGVINSAYKSYSEQQLGAGISLNFGPKKITILGKSDLLGKPLFYVLRNAGFDVEMIGSKELNERIEQKKYLKDSAVIISATGRAGLVHGEMLAENVVLVDVGEPKADMDFASCLPQAKFITPVPGGVGPMTVISLMENGVMLGEKEISTRDSS